MAVSDEADFDFDSEGIRGENQPGTWGDFDSEGIRDENQPGAWGVADPTRGYGLQGSGEDVEQGVGVSRSGAIDSHAQYQRHKR